MAVDMCALWAENGRLCRYLAGRARWIAELDPAITLDDLTQSAFLGLVRAAETFDADAGKSWASWAAWHVKRELRKLLGWSNPHSPPPATAGAVSLDAPINADDDEGATRLDTLSDDTTPDALDGVYAGELRAALTEAVQRLEIEHAAEVLRCRYGDGLTVAETAKQTGMTAGEVKSIQDRSLRRLLYDRKLKRAVTVWDAMPTYSVGVAAFRQYGSQTERAAQWLTEHDTR